MSRGKVLEMYPPWRLSYLLMFVVAAVQSTSAFFEWLLCKCGTVWFWIKFKIKLEVIVSYFPLNLGNLLSSWTDL